MPIIKDFLRTKNILCGERFLSRITQSKTKKAN